MKKSGLGDILLILVNAGALVYAAARSWHVISSSLPPEMIIFGVVALCVTEVALVGWELYYLSAAKTAVQKGIALLMFLAQLAVTGALVAGDTWMVLDPTNAPEYIKLAVLWAVPAILVANMAALFGVHAADPDAQLAQAKRDVQQAIHSQTVNQLRESAASIAAQVSGTGARHYADETMAEFLRSFSGNGHGSQEFADNGSEGVKLAKSPKARKR